MGRVVTPVQAGQAARPENTSDDDLPPSRPTASQTTRKYEEKIPSKTPPLHLSISPRHSDEVILDILGPLQTTLMKGGAVVHSLTRQHRIYFRTCQKCFPCVNRVRLMTSSPSSPHQHLQHLRNPTSKSL